MPSSSSSPPVIDPGVGNSNTDVDVATPVLDIPGAYPADAGESQVDLNSDSTRGAKETIHHTAEAYIAPERLDQVEHLVEDVGSKAAQYVPAGVASAVSSYWCECLQCRHSYTPTASSSSSTTTTYTNSDMSSCSSDSCSSGEDRMWTALGYILVGVGSLLFWGSSGGVGSRRSAAAPDLKEDKEGADDSSTAITDADALLNKAESTDRSKSKDAKGPREGEVKVEGEKGQKEIEVGETNAKALPEPEPQPVSVSVPAPIPIKSAPVEPTSQPPIIPITTTTTAPTTEYIEPPTTTPAADSINPGGGDGGGDGASTPAAAPVPTTADSLDPNQGGDGGDGVALTPPTAIVDSLDPTPGGGDGTGNVVPVPLSGPADGAETDKQQEETAEKEKGVADLDDGVAAMKLTDEKEGYVILPRETPESIPTPAPTSTSTSTSNANASDSPTPKVTAASASTSTPASTPSKPAKTADGQYHPALLHPMNASYTSSTFVSPKSKPSSSPSPPPHASPSASVREKEKEKEKHHHHGFGFGHIRKRTSSIASVGSSIASTQGGRKKVGFLDKVRGEAKVIVGKIEHKKEKVEEGKRILRGED